MKKFRVLALLMALVMVFAVACNSKPAEEKAPAEEGAKAPVEEAATEEGGETPAEAVEGKVAMVTDTGGVNDESFNQSAWQGLQALEKRGAEVSYIESHKDADYAPNIEAKVNEENDLIWGIGYLMKGAIEDAALDNPEQTFALVDDFWEDGKLPNAAGVMFHSEQSSFLVGYIASYMTETNKVGFILGMEGPVMDTFKYGYFAGVNYGAKEQGKDIEIMSVTVESFNDAALGKATATKMYSDGADVIFHAAGNVGVGVIEAAVEADKWVIGVDLDQNHLGPDNVITSAMKNVHVGTEDLSARFLNGEEIGGKTFYYGLEEDAVGIAPTSDKLVPADILEKTHELEQKIKDGDLVIPINEEEYNNFSY